MLRNLILTIILVILLNKSLTSSLPKSKCSKTNVTANSDNAMDRIIAKPQFGGVSKTKKTLRNVTHVIFDLDDTLLDTEGIYELMLRKLCKNHGKELPEGFRERFLGSPVEDALKALKEELNINATLEELIEEMKKITEETYQTTPISLMKGAEKLLRHLHHFGIPMAIATSSFKKEAEIKTSQPHLKELFNYVHHIVTADDVVNGKPAPDIYILASKKFAGNPKQEDCLVFEDAPNGLRAAYSANMQCVFIPEIKIVEEFEQKASIILKSLEEFKPELFGLPPFENKKRRSGSK